MKKKLPYLLFLSSVIFVTLIWEKINIPFSLENAHVGDSYAKNRHHSQNDTVRFIIFLSLPFLILIFYYQKFENNFFGNVKKIIYNNQLIKISSSKLLKFFLFGSIAIILVEFFFIDFKILDHQLDIFHEGLWLTASNNVNTKNEFWQSSYIGRGFIGNFFPFLLWKYFDFESIGITRLFSIFIILCNKILLLLISYRIATLCNLRKYEKIIFYFLLSLTFLIFTSYISPVFFLRSFLLLLFTLLLLNFLSSEDRKKLNLIFLSFLSSLGMFWYIDIGIYINAIIFFLLIFLLIKKEMSSCFYLIFFTAIGWLFIFITIPKTELHHFFKNTQLILSTIDYIHGLIFPTPFISQDTRATKTLILFLVTGFLIIREINFLKKDDQQLMLIISFLFIISIVYFKYGLSRSDGGHIKIASGFLYIPLFSIIYYKIIHFLFKQNNFFSKNLKKITFVLSLIFFVSIFINKKFENKNFINLFSFKHNINSLVSYPDDKFISEDYQNFIFQFKNLSTQDKCVMIFTNEVALPYLLKKPTCSKYYLMYTATPIQIQENLIKDLIKKKPDYLVYKSEIDKYGHVGDRLRLLDNHINEQYSFFKKINHWEVYKKR